MRRFSGLLILVRAFTPLLMVLTIYWGYTQMIDSFRAALAPVQVMEAEIVALGETVQTARAQFDTARNHAEAAIAVIQSFRVPDLLPNLTANLTIPSLSIPDVTVPIVPTVTVVFSNATGSITRVIEGACRTVFDFLGIPSIICDAARTVTEAFNFSYPSGLQFGTANFTIDFPNIPSFTIPTPTFFNNIANSLEGIFSSFDNIFGAFDQTLARINALGQELSAIPESFNTIGQSGQQMIDNLHEVIAERTALAGTALLVALILLVIHFGAGFVQDVLRGLRLLSGG